MGKDEAHLGQQGLFRLFCPILDPLSAFRLLL